MYILRLNSLLSPLTAPPHAPSRASRVLSATRCRLTLRPSHHAPRLLFPSSGDQLAAIMSLGTISHNCASNDIQFPPSSSSSSAGSRGDETVVTFALIKTTTSRENRIMKTGLQTICSQTPPLMIPDVLWHRCSSVCSRIGQRHRARQVDITRIRLEHPGNLFVCVQRPAHPVSPHSIVRRLAGVRY